MSVFTVEPKTGNYELTPAGSHQAVLVALIDLGTHVEKYGDQPATTSRKVFLVWELLDERTEANEPHYIGRRYTLSVHEKSNLGQLIGQLRGKALAKDEGYDLTKLVGKPMLLNVTHETSTKSGKEFSAVAGASPLPKGMKAGKPEATPLQWSVEDGTPIPTASWIPWVHGQELKTVLRESAEMKARGSTPDTSANGGNGNGGDDKDDEIAF